jgi:hypothetical protein
MAVKVQKTAFFGVFLPRSGAPETPEKGPFSALLGTFWALFAEILTRF